jgi:outer membrane protein assembly factor BamB
VVYVSTFQGEIHARVAGTCDRIPDNRVWSYPVPPQVVAAPAVLGDTMVVPVERTMISIDLAADTEVVGGVLVGAENWVFRGSEAMIRSAPTIANGIVYFGNDDGVLFALDLESGEELWRWQTGNGIESAVAALDGVVFVTSTDGTLYAIGGPEAPGRAGDEPADGDVSDETSPSVPTTVEPAPEVVERAD